MLGIIVHYFIIVYYFIKNATYVNIVKLLLHMKQCSNAQNITEEFGGGCFTYNINVIFSWLSFSIAEMFAFTSKSALI